jgi:hypothetical protein
LWRRLLVRGEAAGKEGRHWDGSDCVLYCLYRTAGGAGQGAVAVVVVRDSLG